MCAWLRFALSRGVWGVLAVMVLAGACGDGEPDAGPPTTPTVEVEVHFVNEQLGDPCGEVFPLPRTVPADDAVAETMAALLAGPTAEEEAAGYGGWFSQRTAGRLRSVEVVDGVARVDFDELAAVIPSASSSCGSAALLAQLDTTLRQFPEITDTRYSLNGDVEAFYEWLGYDAPQDGAAPPDPDGTPDPGLVTVEAIVAEVQRQLDAGVFLDPPGPPPAGAPRIVCADSGPVTRGDVFACASEPPTSDQEAGAFVFAVLDEEGTVAWDTATDIPDTTAGLLALYEAGPTGLYCRDLLAADAPYPFGAAGLDPATRYFWSVVYWFLEGQPDHMDSDSDGIPCETLHDADAVASVWSGGPTR
jgi:hypothetical protein